MARLELPISTPVWKTSNPPKPTCNEWMLWLLLGWLGLISVWPLQ
jgi:hypothetical protein